MSINYQPQEFYLRSPRLSGVVHISEVRVCFPDEDPEFFPQFLPLVERLEWNPDRVFVRGIKEGRTTFAFTERLCPSDSRYASELSICHIPSGNTDTYYIFNELMIAAEMREKLLEGEHKQLNEIIKENNQKDATEGISES